MAAHIGNEVNEKKEKAVHRDCLAMTARMVGVVGLLGDLGGPAVAGRRKILDHQMAFPGLGEILGLVAYWSRTEVQRVQEDDFGRKFREEVVQAHSWSARCSNDALEGGAASEEEEGHYRYDGMLH